MKKLMVCALCLCLVSMAHGAVISVVTKGIGSMGGLGTSENPLQAGEVIEIKLILHDNDSVSSMPGYASYGSYDGYCLSSMDIGMIVWNGILSELGSTSELQMQRHVRFGAFASDGVLPTGLPRIQGVSFGTAGEGIVAGASSPDDCDLIWNLKVTVPAVPIGDILLDLVKTPGYLSEYSERPKNWFHDDPWLDMTNADMGDLTLYVVPEPMSMVLLAVGSMVMMRRRS